MFQYCCLNKISDTGLKQFSGQYLQVPETKDADALLVRSANLHGIVFPERLQAIARAGAGVNNIPLEECAKQGIVVFNTPGANANGVKELVFAGLLMAARDILGGAAWVQAHAGDEQITQLAEKEKKSFAGCELRGKKLGIIGLGAIGAQVANTAVNVGMEVYGYDPFLSIDGAWNLSSSIRHISDVNTIYRECDFITIHVPLLESTKEMINEDAISVMKPGVVLLNFARDLLVDEKAVLRAIGEGRVRRYVSDFPNPVTAGQPGVIVTPHLGASTAESEENCAVMAVKELQNFLENGNIRNSVNYPSCDMGVCTSESRVAICHKNVKKMLSRFTELLQETNIVNLSNSSKGEYAYTLLDLDARIPEHILEEITRTEGVFRVRVVK